MIIAVIIFAVANTNILSRKTKSIQTPNGYLSGMQQAGGPPRFLQIRRRRRAAAARRAALLPAPPDF